MSKASRENLLEMGEFYREVDADMIPERDSDQKSGPRPKPRPRTTPLSTSTPNKSGGFMNSAFVMDENENKSPTLDWNGRRARARPRDTFVDVSSSDDSRALPASPGGRKTVHTPISVEVHQSFEDRSEDDSGVHYENERAAKIPMPKPRPRPRVMSISNSETESEIIRPKPRKDREKPHKIASPAKEKEDFLAVTIPENENVIESISPADDDEKVTKLPRPTSEPTIQTPGSSTSLFGMMRKARNFLSTSKSSTEVKDKEKDVIEPEKSPVEFQEVKVQKRKSARRRDAEKSLSDSIGLDANEASVLNLHSPSTSAIAGSSKRDKRRRESLNGQTKLCAITIHGSDMLPSDPNILHPLVKVTVMDQDGYYYTRSDLAEPFDGKSSAKEELSSKRRVTSVLPILTQAYEINHQVPSFAPTWNELLVFEEPFDRFAGQGSSAIFFFEIMDFLPMNNTLIRHNFREYHGNEEGWYKVAWAFLKPVGANGIRNINRRLRLQLYKPEELSNRKMNQGPRDEVFHWWKLGKRAKINATLYVTLKGIVPPTGAEASLRTLLTMRKEHLTQAILDSQMATAKKSRRRRTKVGAKPGSMNLQRPQWSRLEGQSCKVPNKLIHSLPGSQVASLNLTVSGNVHCVKFSPCGLKLAAGLDTDELHVVLIFEIPSGTLLKNLRGHHGLIYDLDWKSISFGENGTTYSNYLASVSADSTVLVWKVEEDSTTQLVKTFSHPSFVYCVKFHPKQSSLIATGCFDYIIRIWDMGETSADSESSPVHCTRPLVILDGHTSFVNSIAFHPDGEFLFSGDGEGFVYKWKISSRNKRKWTYEQNVQVSDGGKHPINDISVHPSSNRLLVQIRDNRLKIIDIGTFMTLITLPGFANEKYQIRSCFSPCGNMVLSGSEIPSLCTWDADTGRILEFIAPENHSNCIVTSVDYHPLDHYAAIGLSSLISEPNPILVYAYMAPPEESFMSDHLPAAIAFKIKSNLHRQRQRSEEDELKRSVTFAPGSAAPRGDSVEKFAKIIKSLDTAVKFKKGGQDGVALRRELTHVTGRDAIVRGENALIAAEKEKSKAEAETTEVIPEKPPTDENIAKISPKKKLVEEWSISSVSEPLEPEQMAESSYKPAAAAARTVIHNLGGAHTPDSIQSDSTQNSMGISSKREKRRRQLQEKNKLATSVATQGEATR